MRRALSEFERVLRQVVNKSYYAYLDFDPEFRAEVRRGIGFSVVKPLVYAAKLLMRVYGGVYVNPRLEKSGAGGREEFKPYVRRLARHVEGVYCVEMVGMYQSWFGAVMTLPQRPSNSLEFVGVAAVVTTRRVVHSQVVPTLYASASDAVRTLVRELRRATGGRLGRGVIVLAIVVPPDSRVTSVAKLELNDALLRLKREFREKLGIEILYLIDGSGGARTVETLVKLLSRRVEGLRRSVEHLFSRGVFYLGSLATYIALATIAGAYLVAPYVYTIEFSYLPDESSAAVSTTLRILLSRPFNKLCTAAYHCSPYSVWLVDRLRYAMEALTTDHSDKSLYAELVYEMWPPPNELYEAATGIKAAYRELLKSRASILAGVTPDALEKMLRAERLVKLLAAS